MNKTGLLFPHKIQYIGWVIFAMVIIVAIGGCIFNYGSGFYAQLSFALWTLVYLAAFLIGFSREKDEDEFIEALRFKSLKTMLCVELAIMVLSGIMLGIPEVGINYPKKIYTAFSIINYFCCRVEFALPLYMLIFKLSVWKYRKEAGSDE